MPIGVPGRSHEEFRYRAVNLSPGPQRVEGQAGGGEMAEEDDAGFRQFVVTHRQALLRTAYLLTGDRGHAEDLVQTALLKTCRHWRRVAGTGDPTAYVRRVLVTTATSWRRRLLTTEQVIDAVPERAHHDRYAERSD